MYRSVANPCGARGRASKFTDSTAKKLDTSDRDLLHWLVPIPGEFVRGHDGEIRRMPRKRFFRDAAEERRG
jgi:hypothetical protein